MIDREQKISQQLERCREGIRKTKGLIEYHKDMLKKQESKESALAAKLEKIKMSALCEVINKSGVDIDLLRGAVQTGNFKGIIPEKAEEKTPENSEDISEKNMIKNCGGTE